jgi:hypothetical protein
MSVNRCRGVLAIMVTMMVSMIRLEVYVDKRTAEKARKKKRDQQHQRGVSHDRTNYPVLPRTCQFSQHARIPGATHLYGLCTETILASFQILDLSLDRHAQETHR